MTARARRLTNGGGTMNRRQKKKALSKWLREIEGRPAAALTLRDRQYLATEFPRDIVRVITKVVMALNDYLRQTAALLRSLA